MKPVLCSRLLTDACLCRLPADATTEVSYSLHSKTRKLSHGESPSSMARHDHPTLTAWSVLVLRITRLEDPDR